MRRKRWDEGGGDWRLESQQLAVSCSLTSPTNSWHLPEWCLNHDIFAHLIIVAITFFMAHFSQYKIAILQMIITVTDLTAWKFNNNQPTIHDIALQSPDSSLKVKQSSLVNNKFKIISRCWTDMLFYLYGVIYSDELKVPQMKYFEA